MPLVALLLAGSAPARTGPAPTGLTELVVTLAPPALAEATLPGRALAASTRARGRVDIRAAASIDYLRTLARAQAEVAARIERVIPAAEIRWRYGVVLDGMAVVVPRGAAALLGRVAGVAQVWPSYAYHALLDRTPQLIGAPALWGPALSTAGNGMKIGIIDDGLDQAHPFFSPKGFTYPAGYPKGNSLYTTPKVIVARAFAPARPTWRYATTPFDPLFSEHATHVAGIAAGDNGTPVQGSTRVSGIAPRAYLGNYKALTIPTKDFGLDGNSPEIAAAIEAAVRDGMDVINLSLGEPEIAPGRDLVVAAIDGAADAGVVPAVAAGNDYLDFRRGSVSSPGSADQAISAAASSSGRSTPADQIASFSSSGPTPISLQLKPDVAAPGLDVLSSVPPHNGTWAIFSGTSMASPHVAGAAALLKQRHPSWTVEQIKSALETTGDPVYADVARTIESATTREGGGRIDLPRADKPLVFTSPTGVSFGLVRAGQPVVRPLNVSDAGGGSGPWTVVVQTQTPGAGGEVVAAPAVVVPGSLPLTASVRAGAPERDVTGFVVLTRPGVQRRIPFWLRAEAPKLAAEPHTTLTRPGVYHGNTAGKPALVGSYRYPDAPAGLINSLPGPEQVYRFSLSASVANFGVVVTSHAPGVDIEPRLVFAGDENHLVGYTGLPLDINPYLQTFGTNQPIVAADRPGPGAYDIVFDTPSAGAAGRFTFRFWIDDRRAPTITLQTHRVRRGGVLHVRISDAGSGVDPTSLFAVIDGVSRALHYNTRTNVATLSTGKLGAGRHRLGVVASDYQEQKNMENVPAILPNTRILQTAFTVR